VLLASFVLKTFKNSQCVNINPLKCSGVRLLHFEMFSAIQIQPTFFNFWHSGALALMAERQSARMS